MIVIGIILVLLGLALGAFVVGGSLADGTATDVSFSLFGLTVDTSVVVVFALGALTLLLLELGVIALRSGARKSSKRRAELQRLRRVEAEVQSRQAAEAQRNATTSAAPAAPAPFARRDPDPSTRPSSSTPFPMGQSASGRQPGPTDSTDRSSAQGEHTHPTAPASTRPPEDTGSASGTSDSDGTASSGTSSSSSGSSATTSGSTGGTDDQPRTDGASSSERAERP